MATETLRVNSRLGSKTSAAGKTSLWNVFQSEWIKLWSVSSILWTLLALLAFMIGFSILFTHTAVSSDDPAWEHLRHDPTGTSLSGISMGQLAIVVLGVLAMTSEYSSGSIRTSLIAVPQRFKLLGAKALVLAPVVLLAGMVTSLAAFAVGQMILSTGSINADLGDPHVLRAAFGGGLFLAANGMFGFALGAVVRNTAGGIAISIAVLKVLPELARQLPGTWGEWIGKLFTSNAGQQILQVERQENMLGPWSGYIVFTLWWLAVLAIAAVLMRRRDA